MKALFMLLGTLSLIADSVLGFQKVIMPLSQFRDLPYRNASNPALTCQVRLGGNAVYFCSNGFIGVINASALFGVWGSQTLSSSYSTGVTDKGTQVIFDFNMTLPSNETLVDVQPSKSHPELLCVSTSSRLLVVKTSLPLASSVQDQVNLDNLTSVLKLSGFNDTYVAVQTAIVLKTPFAQYIHLTLETNTSNVNYFMLNKTLSAN